MSPMFVTLSRDHLTQHIDAYRAVSADVSDWTAEHFLKDLPRKWDLSFAAGIDAYCILSERNGAIHINQLMTAPEKRGQGIGAAMLAEAVRRGATTLKVHPENLGATRFYRRHGWRVTATENGYLVMGYGHAT